jgi:heat shock protein HslJ
VDPRRPLPLLAAFALLAGACAGGSDALLAQDDTWVLAEGGVDGRPIVVPERARITLRPTEEGIGGVAACNSYSGEMSVRGSSVTIGVLARTMMACIPASLMEAEAAYLGALERVTTGARDGDVLVLTGPGIELRFTLEPPVETAELTGTVWLLDGLVAGDAVSSTTTGAEPATLLLRDDGTLEGSTGCRSLTGRWRTDGDSIVVPELAADGDCPQMLAPQDGHVVEVVGDRFRAEVDGQRLTLTSAGGRGLVYRAQEPAAG